MNGVLMRGFAKWVLGPCALAVVVAVAGRPRSPSDNWLHTVASLPAAEKKALESAAALSVANAAWAFGDVEAVRRMARTELDRLPESDGVQRARVFLRFGIVDTNPDGQAAVWHLACASDERVCNHVKEAAQREVQERYVAPGNSLPLSLIGGHPPIPN